MTLLGLTLLDWIILLMLVLSLAQGLRVGVIVAVVSLLSWIVGLVVAGQFWYLAVPVARLCTSTPWLVQLLSFLAIGLLTILLLTLLAKLIRRAIRAVGLGWLDRLLGGAFGLLRGGLVVVLGFIIVAAFLPTVAWTKGSRLAPFFLSAAGGVTRSAPAAAAGRVTSGLQHWQQARGWWRH